MFIDKQLTMSDDQAVTTSAASTNVIDLGVGGVAEGHPIRINCQVTEAFNNCTSVDVKVQTDTVENFASPTELQSALVPLASLAVGYVAPLGTLNGPVEQYLRVYYTVAGATAPTVGKFTSALVLDQQTND
jgi:hypothetical protein